MLKVVTPTANVNCEENPRQDDKICRIDKMNLELLVNPVIVSNFCYCLCVLATS